MQVRINGTPAFYKIATGALIILLASFCIALVTEIIESREFRAKGGRFSEQEGAALERRVLLLEQRMDAHDRFPHPPAWVDREVRSMQDRIEKLEDRR